MINCGDFRSPLLLETPKCSPCFHALELLMKFRTATMNKPPLKRFHSKASCSIVDLLTLQHSSGEWWWWRWSWRWWSVWISMEYLDRKPPKWGSRCFLATQIAISTSSPGLRCLVAMQQPGPRFTCQASCGRVLEDPHGPRLLMDQTHESSWYSWML